ncbi:MAG: hypothetical protein NT039_01915 [Candidatus Berkelbacteria bacterium]|nr:hypothetical protein [Candidatus Berkelbacteria bacterium]
MHCWVTIYLITITWTVAILAANFDWWGEGRVALREDQGQKEETESAGGVTTGTPQGE